MTKYKYITIWTSYDKVEKKMTELSQEGYEYDNCYFVIVRMKKTNTKPKKYKFIYDKNFSPEVTEYYKAAGWRLHKVKLTYFLRLAEGDENSYPIFSDEETEYEIIKYRVLRFFLYNVTRCDYEFPIDKVFEASGRLHRRDSRRIRYRFIWRDWWFWFRGINNFYTKIFKA